MDAQLVGPKKKLLSWMVLVPEVSTLAQSVVQVGKDVTGLAIDEYLFCIFCTASTVRKCSELVADFGERPVLNQFAIDVLDPVPRSRKKLDKPNLLRIFLEFLVWDFGIVFAVLWCAKQIAASIVSSP
jgi:hypothetical protein